MYTHNDEGSNELSESTDSDLCGAVNSSQDDISVDTDEGIDLRGGINKNTSDTLDDGCNSINGDLGGSECLCTVARQSVINTTTGSHEINVLSWPV